MYSVCICICRKYRQLTNSTIPGGRCRESHGAAERTSLRVLRAADDCTHREGARGPGVAIRTLVQLFLQSLRLTLQTLSLLLGISLEGARKRVKGSPPPPPPLKVSLWLCCADSKRHTPSCGPISGCAFKTAKSCSASMGRLKILRSVNSKSTEETDTATCNSRIQVVDVHTLAIDRCASSAPGQRWDR
jgi:hypothetical protein